MTVAPTTRALLLTALLVAAPVAAQELRVSERPIEVGEVPPGTREDQLLYRSLHEGTVEIRHQVNVARQLFFEVHYAKLNLDEIAKGAAPDGSARAKEIRARLDPLATAAAAAMPANGVFGCRYTLMHLEDSMVAAATPESAESAAARRLGSKRVEAAKCDRDTKDALARVVPALQALRAELDEHASEIRERRAAHDAGAPRKDAKAPDTGASPPGAPAAR